MPKGFRLDWKGDQIKDRLLTAARQGIDETMAACVVDAKRETPVRTGALQGSVRFEPAKVRGNEAKGTWGSFDINYAFYIEVGVQAGVATVQAHTRQNKSGKISSVRSHTRRYGSREGRNMLRNAADNEYPKLKKRIAKRFKRSI